MWLRLSRHTVQLDPSFTLTVEMNSPVKIVSIIIHNSVHEHVSYRIPYEYWMTTRPPMPITAHGFHHDLDLLHSLCPQPVRWKSNTHDLLETATTFPLCEAIEEDPEWASASWHRTRELQ